MIFVNKGQARKTERCQQNLIRDVVNTVGRGEDKKGGLVLVLLNLFFWLHPDSVGGAFPLRLFSQVWRLASGGTGYQFTYFLILRRAFWPPRKRVEGYEAEAQFPQYVIQIILTIRNVISFEWVKLIFINP